MRPIVAILETMWGYRTGRAPRYFKINPLNTSGRRLYKLIGEQNRERLLVTNVCRELVTSAKHHGKPDARWLAENIVRLAPVTLLVCGSVAKKTFKQAEILIKANPLDIIEVRGAFRTFDSIIEEMKVVYVPHPAARNWTNDRLREVQRKIQKRGKLT